MKTPRLALLALCIPLGCDRIVREIQDRLDAGSPQAPTPPQQQPVQVPTTPPTTQPNTQGPLGLPIPNIPGLPIPTTGGQTSPPPERQFENAPLPPGSVDATGAFTMAFLQGEARVVLSELIASLGDAERRRVEQIPLNFTQDMAELNAAAGCTRSTRQPFMVITPAMLIENAASAEAKAVDELAGTQVLSAYFDMLTERVRRDQPVVGLAPGAVPAAWAMQPQKLARQRYLLDAQVAFIMGHELAHHYLGHTGCANQGVQQGAATEAEDVQRAVSNLGGIFNQPLEVEADTFGIVDVLDTGRRRAGAKWNEDGAVLSMDFFSRLENFRGTSPLLLFVHSHPPSVLRRPIVQLWAQQWRNGVRPPTPGSLGQGNAGATQPNNNGNNNPLGLPIPIPIPLPGR